MSKTLNILLLGAGKRMSLAERLVIAATEENTELNLFTVESSFDVPIADLASVIIGPEWSSSLFDDFLEQTIKQNEIDIILPLMDGAVHALSLFKSKIKTNVTAMVGLPEFAQILFDKDQTNAFCDEIGIDRIPDSTSNESCFVKPRCGFGSRDAVFLSTSHEFKQFFETRNKKEFLIQEYFPGEEFTFDCWVDDSDYFYSIRSRLEVSSGEVSTSLTIQDDGLDKVAKIFLSNCQWSGPITFQVMRYQDRDYLMEANGRLGGGVINSIHSGFDICRKIIRYHRNQDLKLVYKEGCKMMRANREVFKWL